METFVRSLSCRPHELGAMRRAIESWLSGNGVQREACSAVTLAAHEVAADAMQNQKCETIRIEGRLQAHEVYVELRTDGMRKRPDRELSRGMKLVRQLMDSVSTETSDRGTTVQMRSYL